MLYLKFKDDSCNQYKPLILVIAADRDVHVVRSGDEYIALFWISIPTYNYNMQYDNNIS